MARKGKEPAGLRKWRLAQKRKASGRKVRAAPKTSRRQRTMARRNFRRKGTRKSGKSPIRMVKGIIYAGSIAAPALHAYSYYKGTGKTGADLAQAVILSYAGIDANSKKFDWAVVSSMYAPVAIVAAGDIVTSKLGLQRRLAQGLRGIL